MARTIAPLVIVFLSFTMTDSFAQNTKQTTGELLLSGAIMVKDGDTITIGDVKVRLRGIDAAEDGQQCKAADGSTWDCAKAATDALKELIEKNSGWVRCQHVDTDKKNNRPVARCVVGDVDVQRELVRRGFAWAYREYENCYVREEEEAKKKGLGIWQAYTPPPWEWRERKNWIKRFGASLGWKPKPRIEHQECSSQALKSALPPHSTPAQPGR